MSKCVIIVAGGSGLRMGSKIPKQFLLLKNKPVLMHTIQRFFAFDHQIKIIVVLPNNQIDYWASLCQKYSFAIAHKIIGGGDTRFDSVNNAINIIETDSNLLVAVHDGVRPLIDNKTISTCFETAEKLGNAVPCVPIIDSLRFVEKKSSHTVNRNDYKAVQTPQVFHYTKLLKAYSSAFTKFYTDDASVVESIGEKIYLVEGNVENIKITTTFDLLLAELILDKNVL